jgi:hypothetical protein
LSNANGLTSFAAMKPIADRDIRMLANLDEFLSRVTR